MSQGHFFDISALTATLPATAETMLRDIRLTDEVAASCRIFRVYRPAPLHFHTACDEYLYVLQGRGRIQIQDEVREVGPGDLIHFKVRVVHGTPEILEHPFVFLAIDTPRRPPEDVHFVNPADGDALTFIASQDY
ncbi:cupin domain-containing protein [Terriglobus roseus]|uniref:Mannose-6-phosphate isomerase, cupin superfamily n=1 Tax=Terriglobus roseus TaxID=392734 RepID=A0A1H4PA35_9BACT|nr:cupin domain-containing protein [Terriglobus roseus]SEC04269.1 Mannose-6-phosphate isomerase, cupin superfamily [Terriglobus roseus]